MRRVAILPMVAVLAVSCSNEPTAPAPQETEVPEELASAATPPDAPEDDIGTPMAERVATLGLLNKRNNISQDLEMSPGDSRRIGDVIVRLSACERSKPWEFPKQTGAFVQVLVQDASPGDGEGGDWRKVFSGWLFKESPSVNVVEHPVYDVWIKQCAMSFPGEPAPRSTSAENASGSEESASPEASETNEQ